MSHGFRRQATTVFTAIVAMIGVIVVLQLWLLTASLESVLAGSYRPAVAGTIGSALLFLVGAALVRYVVRLDREVSRSDGVARTQVEAREAERAVEPAIAPTNEPQRARERVQ